MGLLATANVSKLETCRKKKNANPVRFFSSSFFLCLFMKERRETVLYILIGRVWKMSLHATSFEHIPLETLTWQNEEGWHMRLVHTCCSIDMCCKMSSTDTILTRGSKAAFQCGFQVRPCARQPNTTTKPKQSEMKTALGNKGQIHFC